MNNIIKMIFAALVFVVIVLCATAAERRTYPCHRLAQAPVVDGILNDEAWKNIPEATGFYMFPGSGKYAVEKQTCFKAGWTEDAIYLLVRSEESAPENLTAKCKDGGALWGDDSIELFFVPPGTPAYTQLIMNSAGSRYNGRSIDGGTTTLLDWEAKASVGKTEWLLEARIPFKTLLANPPKEGDEWPVNVGRNNVVGPASERNTCWPLLTKGFHETANYGHFVFKGAAGPADLNEEKEINQLYVRDARPRMQAEIKAWADMAGKYNPGLADAQKFDSLRGESEDLLRIWAQAQKLAAQPEPDWQELRAARRDCFKLKHRSEDCITRLKMEKLFQE